MADSEGQQQFARGAGPWTAGWRRLRRDRWSLVALGVFIAVVLLAFAGSAVVSKLVGHNGTDPFPYGVDQNTRPVGPWTWVPKLQSAPINDYGQLLKPPRGTPKTLFVLGADGPLGRDEFIRLLDGARTSLEIGIGGVLFALLIALPIGAVAGYFGGFADAVVSRLTETIMAFPLLLFLVFASAKLTPSLRSLAYGSVLPIGVVGEALLIGTFTSFYPLRLIRAQLKRLRHAEFVEAAQMIGAKDLRILRRHLFPHVVPTLLVWGAIAVATNLLLEVGISFIGVGVQPETPTLGSLLATTWGTIYFSHVYNSAAFTPWQTIFPTGAILLIVVTLNRLSEGVRRAIEPWSRS